MKKILLSLIFLFVTAISNAQTPKFEWAKQIGGTSNDEGWFVATDQSGNVYTTGFFSATVDFDSGSGIANLTSAGDADVFISKFDASGQFIWAKRIGGTSKDLVYSIATDRSGNIFTTGYFYQTADFDPGAGTYNLTAAGSYDIFISKIDPSGNFLWAKRIGAGGSDVGYDLTTDINGNVYTTGQFGGMVDFDPGLGTYNLTGSGLFVSKLDSLGNFIMAKGLSGGSGFSIELDSLGNIYTSGYFSGTTDFDPGTGIFNLKTVALTDQFILKLNPSGNFVWAVGMDGDIHEFYNPLSVTSKGNVYVNGGFVDTVDFNPGIGINNLISFGGYDAFISKLDNSGNLVWVKRIGGIYDDKVYSTFEDASGYIYCIGGFQGTVDFDPGQDTFNITAGNAGDNFILKLDANGNFVWAINMGKGASRIGTIDASFNIYTIGSFIKANDFDPGSGTFNLTPKGRDAFVCKLSQCPSINGTVTVNGVSIKSNHDSAAYQWIDCDKGNKLIVGETGQTYTPKVSGNYAVVVSVWSCSDTSSCVKITTGIKRKHDLNSIKIYPNPYNGIFNIMIEDPTNSAILEIYNCLGDLVYTGTTYERINAIDLTETSAGLYLVKVVFENDKSIIQKVVKQ